MTDSLLTQLLALIKHYEKRLLATPEVKNEPLDFDENQMLRVRPELRNLWARPDIQSNSFRKFAFAKYALNLCIRTNYLIDVRDLIAPWLNACVDAGAYEDGAGFAEDCMRSEVLKSRMKPAEYFSMLRSHAKSWRNRGKFPQAQQAYRHLIDAAAEMGAQTELNFGLLLIGKLYGNYLGQRSLFSSFVEESLDGFTAELAQHNLSDDERRRVLWGLAICHDALGQAYRDSPDREKIERHFLEAIRINREIGRDNGISRAICHLYHFKFKHASSPQDMASHLKDFSREGVALLTQYPRDERGMSIRFIQLASMLHKVGQTPKALTYLASGKSLARRYSLFKTFTQATVVESEIFRTIDADRAIRSLEEGRLTAQNYNLMIQETEINRLLAELEAMAPGAQQFGPRSKPFDLFSRNRIILMDLIGEVNKTLAQLDSSNELKAEFKRLGRKTRRTFREKLLLDFGHIVEKLNLNILSLLRTFDPNEQGRNLFEIFSSVNPLFLAEYEAFILADITLTTFNDVAAGAAQLADTVRQGSGRRKSSKAGASNSDVVAALVGISTQLQEVGSDLQKLRNLLRGRVGQSELEGMFSLQEVCERAIGELVQQTPRAKELISFRADCDVQVKFYYRILVVAVRNLLRSLLTATENTYVLRNKILLWLRPAPSRFSTLRNQVKNALLSAETTLEDEENARVLATAIYNALENDSSQAVFSATSDLDLPKFVFKERIGASIRVSQEKSTVAIEIILETDILQVGISKDAET